MTTPQPVILDKTTVPKLPPRPLDAHKGQFGHLLIIGGDHGTGGAPLLSAEMALRAGAGMVSMATRPEYICAVLARRPEIMCLGIHSANQLYSLTKKANVLVVGMGLGQSAWSQSLLSIVATIDKPQVWDADALNLLSQGKAKLPRDSIITPHLGEAARLLNCDIKTIQQDKVQAAIKIRQQYQCTVVLKGKGTLIAGLDNSLTLCEHGHPAMAGAGLGDVLAGLIGALLAQHLTATEAAQLAVWLHARAGEQLGKQGRGLLASDLFPVIRKLLEEHCPCL
ncbi:NAD(P)H-hydrate dehydratase [Entomomonas asaccharolytica]|uniref:ADP-dependent (S)-NAD(P)H-hydrate dehydratase n=1 Tax=Entomomonas asaccharolytica TaxID=2785331 RepID=A0A974NF23_9GAMM|nr:NAD(P)H-hydrate dehydratase [Entomomonas asaccharolytica]QQP85420.1 NAD(P)H-hydrate dehydratase [Entomomonas asaccharolytica]